MKRLYCILLMLGLFIFSCTTTKQVPVTGESTAPASPEYTEILPVDSTVTLGKLDNGITYFIRENHKPEKRMELRLVVKVGSIMEDDDQRGLAHFIEHMAFNGTRNFRKQELVDYLESIGMRFGPDLNAYTSFDETVYMLQVPVDSLHIVEKAFQILEDWAHNISFEDEEIDRERGVIVEEWRSGRGAQARIRDKQFPVLFKDSRYADRLPIGKMEVVETFPYDTLRRFYRDWYRPDLLAVIAVGDFDAKWIKELIRRHFSHIPSPEHLRERVIYTVPGHEETLFAIATDPEATGNRVSIYYKHDVVPEVTIGDYRDRMVAALYNGMLNQRLHELTKKPDPPFLYGYSSKGRLVLSREIYMLGAGVKDNGIEHGLEALMTEAVRVRKYGFTQSELERQKKEILRHMEQAYNERDKTESRNYAGEYIRNFVMDEPIPGIEYEYEMYRKYIPGITLEDINRLTGEWMTNQNRVIMVDAPEKSGVSVPTEEELLAVIKGVNEKDIEPYVDSVSDQPLVESTPVPSPVVSENRIEEIKVTEWVLANGVRVILKPTDFKNDEILFTSFSPGGSSLVSDEYHMAGETAAAVVREGGVGKFSRIELEKMLSGKIVSVSPWIDDLREGISGSASPKDVETMFQLIYLYFTSPRKDDTAFQSFRARMKGYIENRNARPETALSDTVTVTMAQYHHRERPLSEELLDEMNLDKSFEIYRNRFSDASDFTFVFIGNFEQSQLKPLVETYLGGLPSLNRVEIWKDNGIYPPKGIIIKEVKKGIESKSQVNIIFTGPFEWSRQNRYDLNSMISVLRIKLRETLREDMSGTYGVGISASRTHYPRSEYRLTINFGCNPERVDELTSAVFSQIDSLKTYGTTEKYLTKVKETQRRARETYLKENSFWLSNLEFYYYHDEDPLGIMDFYRMVDNLSLDAIQQAAREYFDTNNYVKVVLYPEDQ